MADVSPMTTHDAGAGPRVNSTEIMSPRDACAREAAVFAASLVTGTEAATPNMINRNVLNADPQT
jgi:hypothetical protein